MLKNECKEEFLTVSEFYNMGFHKRLKIKFVNLQCLHNVINRFYKKHPELGKFIKRLNYKKTVIVNIDEFIDLFNDLLVLQNNWNSVYLDCLDNNMDCKNCYYPKNLETFFDNQKECNIRFKVIKLLNEIGKPLFLK